MNAGSVSFPFPYLCSPAGAGRAGLVTHIALNYNWNWIGAHPMRIIQST